MDNIQIISDHTPEEYFESSTGKKINFQFDIFADLIKNAIVHSNQIPKSIAIFGEWGTGKTTLMKIIDKKLHEDSKNYNIVTVWFDSWRYANEPNPLIPLLYTIRDTLVNEDGDVYSELKIFLDNFLDAVVDNLEMNITLGLATINLPKLMKSFRDQTGNKQELAGKSEYYDVFQSFKKILKEKAVHFVIFVDDLDRCQPDRVITLIETIKLIMEMENTTVLIGADHLFLREAVKAHYKDLIDGQAFIKKIFPVSFVIPYPEDVYVLAYIDDLLTKIGCDKIEKEQVAEIFMLGGEHNPREIKRLINSYAISRKLIASYVPQKAALLVVIQQEWPIMARYISSQPEEFITYCQSVRAEISEEMSIDFQGFTPDSSFIYFVKHAIEFFDFKEGDELKHYMNLISISALESLLEHQIEFKSEKLTNGQYRIHPITISTVLSQIDRIVYKLPKAHYTNPTFETSEKENFSIEIQAELGTEIEIDVYFKSNPERSVGYSHRISLMKDAERS